MMVVNILWWVLLVEFKDKSKIPRNKAQEEVVLTSIRQTTYNHKGNDGAGQRKLVFCFNEHVRAHLCFALSLQVVATNVLRSLSRNSNWLTTWNPN
jgi:hypothetical protein